MEFLFLWSGLMMNGSSRLSEALAAHPDVLEYVISLNPHDFERLRNPLLRKVMPPRINLRRVAAIAGISEHEFLEKIHAIAGIPFDGNSDDSDIPQSPDDEPEWLHGADLTKIVWVDLAPIDAVLGDPMPPINVAVNKAKPGEIVGIIHKWEPQPLYDIWQGRGFKFYATQEGAEPGTWHIFVYKPH